MVEKVLKAMINSKSKSISRQSKGNSKLLCNLVIRKSLSEVNQEKVFNLLGTYSICP